MSVLAAMALLFKLIRVIAIVTLKPQLLLVIHVQQFYIL